MTIQEKLYTADDLWNLKADNKRIELVKGELVEMAGSGGINTKLALRIASMIFNYVEQHDLGHTTGADGTYILFKDPDTARIPDVGFISKSRLPVLPEKFIPMAPDLAVEVVSPGDDANDIRAKIYEFFEAGTRLVWVVYPRLGTVDVYTAVDQVQVVKGDGSLDGGAVLPGFTLPLADVFKNLS